MLTPTRSAFLGLALLLALGLFAQPAYNPSGVQTNVPLSTVTSGGWSECYTDTYATANVPLATILAACSGDRLMLACRAVNSPATLLVLAEAPRTDVLTPNAASFTDVHVANGVGWYFGTTGTGGQSQCGWGFAPEGAAVYHSCCDTNAPGEATRLCFHTYNDLDATDELMEGWRCGINTGLDNSTEFERVIFTASNAAVVPPVPTVSAWAVGVMLAAFAIIGLIVTRA